MLLVVPMMNETLEGTLGAVLVVQSHVNVLGAPTCCTCACRSAGVTGWSCILRSVLTHQEHYQALGMDELPSAGGTCAYRPGRGGR